MVAKQPEDLLFASRDQKQVLRSLRSHQDDSGRGGVIGTHQQVWNANGANLANWANRSSTGTQVMGTSPIFLGNDARDVLFASRAAVPKNVCPGSLRLHASPHEERFVEFLLIRPIRVQNGWRRPDDRGAPPLYGGGGPPRPGRPGPNGGGPPLPRPRPSTSGM